MVGTALTSNSGNRLIRFTCLLLLGGSLLGCASAYREEQARTFGEFTDDLAIGAKLKSQLLADGQVSGLRVNVDVHRGTVTLRGKLPSPEMAARVAAIAGAVKGVAQVDNQLRYPDSAASRSR